MVSLGIVFLAFTSIYAITILYVKNIIQTLERECENNELGCAKKLENIKSKIKEMRGTQLYRNPNLVFNAIEEIIKEPIDINHNND